MAKNLISGDTTTINENGNDISVDLNEDYKDTVDSVGYANNLETTDKTSLVNAINETYERTLDDSGWLDLTLSSGISGATLTGKPQIRKVGKMVYIRGGVSFTLSSPGTGVGFATIPEGFRPAGSLYKMAATGGTRYCRVYYSTGGGIGMDWMYNINGTQVTSGSITWLDISLSYMTD